MILPEPRSLENPASRSHAALKPDLEQFDSVERNSWPSVEKSGQRGWDEHSWQPVSGGYAALPSENRVSHSGQR